MVKQSKVFILGLSGKSQAGKDTVADVLVSKFGFNKLSFADPLKRMCSDVFDIPIRYFYDTKLKDNSDGFVCCINSSSVSKLISYLRNEGFTVNNKLKKTLNGLLEGTVFKTPRNLLMVIGTDICRKYVDDNIWLTITMNIVKESKVNIVVPDCRFINEIKGISSLGGYIGTIIRSDNVNNNAEGHISEQVPEYDYDITFNNNGNLVSFQREVELWYQFLNF